ncbi:MAG: bifunctional metallophosphatase/5'-nucleotidase [Bacteroidaceae bacterium]|nr:bifunctional metallophosphatase/5'-nucleotidase [Bacteroidaceae bacterium]
MKRKILALTWLIIVSACSLAQNREIHILSANDIHAKLEYMPQLSAIVDSLRAIDPQLLVISAGDNRTGNPINDQYEPTNYPMVSLMNFIGFDCSTFGNHEFDSRQSGLAEVINLSNFPYINANTIADPSLGIHNIPYKIFNIDGISISILGVVQLGTKGFPDTHPDNIKGIHFSEPEKTIKEYKWITEKCNVNILLSHLGYKEDIKMSSMFPYYDLIIGGHTHTQINGGEIHNGVLITQNVNKLKRVTLTTLTVENGKVVKKEAKNIEVSTYPKKNHVAEEMVRYFNDNDFFQRQIAIAETPFSSTEELGMFMCDAIAEETKSDFAIWNYGGVRLEELPSGPITVNNILQLDPFGNKCVELHLTGEELINMLVSCYTNDEKLFPLTSSKLYTTITFDTKDNLKIKKIDVRTADGRKLNKKKTYKVVTNSYTSTICDSPRNDKGTDLNVGTSDLIIQYLERIGKVNYSGKKCQTKR